MRTLVVLVPMLLMLAGCNSDPVTSVSTPGVSNLGTTSASSEWDRSSFYQDVHFYAPCLGEDLHYFGEVPYIWHSVADGSGGFHVNYQVSPVTPNSPPFQAVGDVSGTVYVYANGGPISVIRNMVVGEVYNQHDREVYIAENGDRLISYQILHFTINANGDLSAYREVNMIECIGVRGGDKKVKE